MLELDPKHTGRSLAIMPGRSVLPGRLTTAEAGMTMGVAEADGWQASLGAAPQQPG